MGFDFFYITNLRKVILNQKDEKYSDYYTCAHMDREGFVFDNGKLLYATQFLSHKFSEKHCETIRKRFVGSEIKISNIKNIIIDFEMIKNFKDEDSIKFILEKNIEKKVMEKLLLSKIQLKLMMNLFIVN